MNQNQLKELAVKYCIEDLTDSSRPGTFLANVICRIELAPDFIPEITKECLEKAKLKALLKYACKQISFAEYLNIARSEQKERDKQAAINAERNRKRKTLNAERNRKIETLNKLFQNYDLDAFLINHGDIQKLKKIIGKANQDLRLNQNEIAWLMIARKGNYYGYYTQNLREKYHKNEADFFSTEFKKTKNPWDAINASSHFRKCHHSKNADTLLTSIDATNLKSKKIKSALKTTFGGVKRDLKKFEDALSFGNKAHILTPNDFRPCTLLGAVNIEIGNYGEGQSWYAKAIKRGATEKSIDDDLRSIFMRSKEPERNNLAEFLYKNDPKRYRWVKKWLK